MSSTTERCQHSKCVITRNRRGKLSFKNDPVLSSCLWYCYEKHFVFPPRVWKHRRGVTQSTPLTKITTWWDAELWHASSPLQWPPARTENIHMWREIKGPRKESAFCCPVEGNCVKLAVFSCYKGKTKQRLISTGPLAVRLRCVNKKLERSLINRNVYIASIMSASEVRPFTTQALRKSLISSP